MSIATIMMVAIAGVAGADQWNDRTKLTFEAPIMIPGTTLAPGTYTFKLLDSQTSRHVVQVFNEDGTKLIATTHAVPAKRMDVSGDTMVKLNPTEAGAPIALKAWFYPGSRYGHEFVYSDQQARSIAQRTKTLVLSEDTHRMATVGRGRPEGGRHGRGADRWGLLEIDCANGSQPAIGDARLHWRSRGPSEPVHRQVHRRHRRSGRCARTAPLQD
jgi:hypothetical protein